MKLNVISWAVALSISTGCGVPAYEAARVPHGELSQRNGAWVLQLDGTPTEMGTAAGQLVGAQVRWALPRYLRATVRTPRPEGRLLELVASLRAGVPSEHLRELEAFASAAGVDDDSLLLANLAPEVFASMACSCMAAGAGKGGGRVIMARNLDWFGGDVLRGLGLVVVVNRRFASLTWPGLIGVVTGINSEGLAAANLVVLRQNAEPQPGVPVTFALRRMLEQQRSVVAAADWLERQSRTVPQNYMLADAQGSLVLETWSRRFRRRAPVSDFLAVGNLFDEDREAHPAGRYVRMQRVGAAARLDVAELQAGLREVSMGDMTVQSAILIPGERLLYGSTHARPAADGPYWRLDLRSLLGPKAR